MAKAKDVNSVTEFVGYADDIPFCSDENEMYTRAALATKIQQDVAQGVKRKYAVKKRIVAYDSDAPNSGGVVEEIEI